MGEAFGGLAAVVLVALPLTAGALGFVFPTQGRRLAGVTAVASLAALVLLTAAVVETGPLHYRLGGWSAPLGIAWRLDGLAVFMILVSTVTGVAVSIYASRYLRRAHPGIRGYWPLWLFLWASLNALFLSGDVFNLYVTLELMGLAAVALVALAGGRAALTGAMKYLLMTMVASLSYLLGVALVYHQAGTLDLGLIGNRLTPAPAAHVGVALMMAALVMKSALFPLHFWLPPAHASAPAPVSALLSALVVKAGVYMLIRLWVDVVPAAGGAASGQLLALFGAGAIVWGSLQALRQTDLKLLVAYSTVAQLGYLFLPFALGRGAGAMLAWQGAAYFVLCHALAKSAMFMVVGNLSAVGGVHSVTELRRMAQRLPLSLAAFGIAGVTLVGLPPSGGFAAKWLLLEGSLAAGQGWVAAVVLLGGLLSALYVFKVVGAAFEDDPDASYRERFHDLDWMALGVALLTLLLGFLAPLVLPLLDVGTPFASEAGP